MCPSRLSPCRHARAVVMVLVLRGWVRFNVQGTSIDGSTGAGPNPL
jgi:hypothetical protein